MRKSPIALSLALSLAATSAPREACSYMPPLELPRFDDEDEPKEEARRNCSPTGEVILHADQSPRRIDLEIGCVERTREGVHIIFEKMPIREKDGRFPIPQYKDTSFFTDGGRHKLEFPLNGDQVDVTLERTGENSSNFSGYMQLLDFSE